MDFSTSDKERITALLELRNKLEQEIRADVRKLEDLKGEVEKRRRWISYLDEVLSDASFQPASSLIGNLDQVQELEYEKDVDQESDEQIDLSTPVNIKRPSTGEIVATIRFVEGNVLIVINDAMGDLTKKDEFVEFMKRKVLDPFEKAGGRIFLERDENSGNVRSITVMGTFSTDLKIEVVKNLKKTIFNLDNEK